MKKSYLSRISDELVSADVVLHVDEALVISLVRSSNSLSKLENILDDNGTLFVSNNVRTERIVRYFEDIYRKPDTDMVNYDNGIVDFLGEELSNHPIISNSKLTDSE